jgi:hypothetical protein
MKLVDAAATDISAHYTPGTLPRLSMKPASTTTPVHRECLEHIDDNLRDQLDKACPKVAVSLAILAE